MGTWKFTQAAVSAMVDLIATGEHSGYRNPSRDFVHQFIRHSNDEYATDAGRTQAIDGFWSLLKRGIMGTFHKVSAKYLPPYVAEFEWRYNNRNNADIFGEAVARC